MYGGIGRTTSNLAGLARPSFALMLDKNNCGENGIRICS